MEAAHGVHPGSCGLVKLGEQAAATSCKQRVIPGMAYGEAARHELLPSRSCQPMLFRTVHRHPMSQLACCAGQRETWLSRKPHQRQRQPHRQHTHPRWVCCCAACGWRVHAHPAGCPGTGTMPSRPPPPAGQTRCCPPHHKPVNKQGRGTSTKAILIASRQASWHGRGAPGGRRSATQPQGGPLHCLVAYALRYTDVEGDWAGVC
jgi:hypothetical protein